MLKQIINQENKPEAPKKDAAPAPGTPPTSAPAQSAAPTSGMGTSRMSGSKNILSSDVDIRGKLKFSNELIIDGRIEGEVNSQGDLTVGENANVEGDIKTRSVTVFGKVKGNITVTDRCELKQNAELLGDVTAGKLAIEEGASFVGSSKVGAAASRAAASSTPSSSPAPSGGEKKDENKGDS